MPVFSQQKVLRQGLAPWCSSCPLRGESEFKDFSETELAYMDGFKQDHGTGRAGDVLIRQGDTTPRLMTLFSGWAVRYQSLPTGERQIISIMLPGDLIGLESVLCGAPHHSVNAITEVSFCIFDPARIDEFLSMDGLARRLICLQALEQRQLEERLTTVGTCDSRRSLAFLFWDIHHRLQRRGAVHGLSFRLPLTHQNLAEALGITTVHVHRTLRRLREQGVLQIRKGRATIYDLDRLQEAACLPDRPDDLRPLI